MLLSQRTLEPHGLRLYLLSTMYLPLPFHTTYCWLEPNRCCSDDGVPEDNIHEVDDC